MLLFGEYEIGSCESLNESDTFVQSTQNETKVVLESFPWKYAGNREISDLRIK